MKKFWENDFKWFPMEMRRERYLTVVECFAPGDIFGLDDDQIKRESVVGTGCLY